MLQAAITEVCITPPVGVELAGYGPNLERYSTDILDPLMAQALVLDDGQQRIALITLDVIGLSTEFVQTIRKGVAERTGIPAENVMVAAIHSHTTPTTDVSRGWGMPDLEYVHMTARQVIGAVVASSSRLEPATLRVGRGEHPDLPWNRIGQPDVDPTVEVLLLDGVSGEPLAILVHFACHPVILGPKPLISPDYPGALRRTLRAKAPSARVMFLNGACGDIDPVTQAKVWGQGTPEDVERAGRGLGEDALQIALAAEPRDVDTIRVARCPWTLHYDIPERAAVRQKVAEYKQKVKQSGGGPATFGAVTEQVEMPEFWLDYYQALDERLAAGALPGEETVELQAFILAEDVALIGLPAEVYTRQGQAIRAEAPYAHVLPVCYANGLVGYIPPVEEFQQQGYSASLASAVYDRVPFKPDVASTLVKAAVGLLTEARQSG